MRRRSLTQIGPYGINGPQRGKPLRTYQSRSSRLQPEETAAVGCFGCFGCAWLIYVVAFFAFWIIVALALIHYIHGH